MRDRDRAASRETQGHVRLAWAAAAVLLGLASLPPVALPASRANEVIARHRVEIAGLGAAAFVGVVVAFLLG